MERMCKNKKKEKENQQPLEQNPVAAFSPHSTISLPLGVWYGVPTSPKTNLVWQASTGNLGTIHPNARENNNNQKCELEIYDG